MFVHGWTVAGRDGRTEILLASGERDQILAEMRLLLKAVHGVVAAAGDPQQDLKPAESAARAAGMAMAADVNPAIMAKLPLAFKQMGMSVHQDMDRLADAVSQGESATQILGRLSSITARCTTCHDMYRLPAKP
jgi:cytochrome c556